MSEFDPFAGFDEDEDEEEVEETPAVEEAADHSAHRAKLEAAVAAGGVRGQLAAELLVALDERIAREAKEKLVADVEAGTETDPEAVKDVIRYQVLELQAATDQRIIDETVNLMVADGYARDGDNVRQAVADLREAMAKNKSFFEWDTGGERYDPLNDSPVYREAQIAAYAKRQEQSALYDMYNDSRNAVSNAQRDYEQFEAEFNESVAARQAANDE